MNNLILVFAGILILLMILLCQLGNKASAKGTQNKNYKLTIEAGWNLNRYVNQPENFDVENIVVVTHSADFTLFDVGQLASPGIIDYTENNRVNSFINEARKIPQIKEVYKLAELRTLKENSVKVRLDENTNFVGVVANIDNNHGVFAGIDVGLDVRDFAKREIIIPLVIYEVTANGAIVVSDDQYHYWRTVDPIGYLRIEKI